VYAGRLADEPATIVVVSRTGRNRSFSTVIAAEVQVGRKLEGLASAVTTGEGDPVDGVVLPDYLWTLDKAVIDRLDHLGDLSPGTMKAVDAALAVALDIG
ncbi:MAG: type II toxin-antitoxin system PemK/MazF family toxin, partial [Acidimicrobiia bacterium]|nr:type II toxin-antitoxin system PemK/MazF family toxin [Acidimicrobiia bacterium]